MVIWQERIKNLRKTTGLSQERFAQILGISFGTVQKWEIGLFNPSRMAQEKICALEAKIKKGVLTENG